MDVARAVEEFNNYLNDLKQNAPYGSVVFLNEKGTYTIKNLEFIDYADEVGGERLILGCQIDEPLFFVSLFGSEFRTTFDSVLSRVTSFYECLSALEYSFFERATVPSLVEYKIGPEHFRKAGSYFVIVATLV